MGCRGETLSEGAALTLPLGFNVLINRLYRKLVCSAVLLPHKPIFKLKTLIPDKV
jgi:hypothetical protein